MVLNAFDPWNSSRCTCPSKYSFCPYTGCPHGCLYCYITSYIPRPFEGRAKRDVLQRLARELRGADVQRRYASMANSSDPYPPMEREQEITRRCLELFRERQVPVLVVTKSDLVARDAGLLAGMQASVSLSVTTLRHDVARRIEPGAPSPSKRLEALRTLSENGIPCSVRLDPLIPGLTDGEVEDVVSAVAPYCRHVVSSTVKPRSDGLQRLRNAMPDVMEQLRLTRRGNTYWLPEEQRRRLMRRVGRTCRAHGLTFASCREGFAMDAPSCDGGHLLPSRQ
ncbi:MAG: radical SAM protein [Candidatus Thermoplasmatota archaeon]|nr:radical SAM protein [Candidatus Thermoplasmatota archaeon]